MRCRRFRRARRLRASDSTELSDQAGAPDRTVPSRQSERLPRPHRRSAAFRDARASRRARQSRRRRRDDRRRSHSRRIQGWRSWRGRADGRRSAGHVHRHGGAAAVREKRKGKRQSAISSASRSSLLPAMPTLIESGLPGYTMGLSMGILAPAKTPAVVLRTLNREIVEATVASQRFANVSSIRVRNPSAARRRSFHQHIASPKLRRYKDVIQAAGIQAE